LDFIGDNLPVVLNHFDAWRVEDSGMQLGLNFLTICALNFFNIPILNCLPHVLTEIKVVVIGVLHHEKGAFNQILDLVHAWPNHCVGHEPGEVVTGKFRGFVSHFYKVFADLHSLTFDWIVQKLKTFSPNFRQIWAPEVTPVVVDVGFRLACALA